MGRVAFGTLPTTSRVYSPTSSVVGSMKNNVDVNRIDVMKANVPTYEKSYVDNISRLMYRLGN